MILNKPFSSFQVDSLSKRWAAALLLLFAWGVSFLFFMYPIGDPDFSQLAYWYEDMSDASDYVSYIDAHPLTDVFTMQNVIYILSVLGYIAVMHLIGLFYFTMYVCDLREVPLSKAPKIYFTRIWWMILYSATLMIPGLIVLAILPYIFLFLIPALYVRSGIVLFEKKDIYTATVQSFSKTRGHKLSIFMELSGIALILVVIRFLVNMFLKSGSTGLMLVEAFLFSYFTLAIFRNMGTRFHMITTLNK